MCLRSPVYRSLTVEVPRASVQRSANPAHSGCVSDLMFQFPTETVGAEASGVASSPYRPVLVADHLSGTCIHMGHWVLALVPFVVRSYGHRRLPQELVGVEAA